MADHSDVAILLVSYYSSALTGRALQSVQGTLCPGDTSPQIVIVDNSCDSEESSKLLEVVARSTLPGVTVIVSESNSGYGAGNNRAAAAVPEARVLLIMNPDVTWQAADLEGLKTELRSHPKMILGFESEQNGSTNSGLARLHPLTGRSSPLLASESCGPLAYASGHLFAIDRDLWESLCGFDESYFLYCEELDLALRARNAGAALASSSSISATHVGGSTTGSEGTKSTLTHFHANRSRAILYRKHRSLRVYLPLMVVARSLLAVARVMSGKRGQGVAVLSGLWSGINQRG